MGKTLLKGENCNFIENLFSKKTTAVPGRKQTVFFEKAPYIIGASSVVGDKESKGPLGKYFNNVKHDVKLGEKCFERAEIRMLEEAISDGIKSAGKTPAQIDILITGDLLNQMTSSSYVARSLNVPHVGVYSACSTMTESLALGACMLNAGYFSTAACATVSHFATAERQFRYPLEYGCQRPPYSQWTVTAAGCTVLSSEQTGGAGARIKSATFGKVIDFGTNDISNMGAAMAPADAIIELQKVIFGAFNTQNTSKRREEKPKPLSGSQYYYMRNNKFAGRQGTSLFRRLLLLAYYEFNLLNK